MDFCTGLFLRREQRILLPDRARLTAPNCLVHNAKTLDCYQSSYLTCGKKANKLMSQNIKLFFQRHYLALILWICHLPTVPQTYSSF